MGSYLRKKSNKDINIVLKILSTLTHDIKRSYNNLHIFLTLLEQKNGDQGFIKQHGPQLLNDIDQNHKLVKETISYLKETDHHINPQKKATPSTANKKNKINRNDTNSNNINKYAIDNKSIKILVVEDDVLQLVDMVEKISVAFPDAKITNCKTIEKALLQASKDPFDIVITDYHFENEPFSGADLIKQMQNNSSAAKYILISSHQIDLDELDLKIDGFLTKPLQPKELLKLINM